MGHSPNQFALTIARTYKGVCWTVLFADAFVPEFRALAEDVQDAIRTYPEALAELGPQMGRPRADTLKGSAYPNMKELRPTVNKVEWRVAFAFDKKREAVLLAAVAKGGDKTAYNRLIATADKRFADHLEATKDEE